MQALEDYFWIYFRAEVPVFINTFVSVIKSRSFQTTEALRKSGEVSINFSNRQLWLFCPDPLQLGLTQSYSCGGQPCIILSDFLRVPCRDRLHQIAFQFGDLQKPVIIQ